MKKPESIPSSNFRNRIKQLLVLTLIAATGALATGSETKASGNEAGNIAREMVNAALQSAMMKGTPEFKEAEQKIFRELWGKIGALNVPNRNLDEGELEYFKSNIMRYLIKAYLEWRELNGLRNDNVYQASISNFLKKTIGQSNPSTLNGPAGDILIYIIKDCKDNPTKDLLKDK